MKWKYTMGKNIKPLILLGQILCIFVTWFSSINSVQAATPPFWKDAGYIYAANQTPIRKILEDFCDQFGIVLEISPTVKGTINGRLAANSANEFLDRLALMRKFRWFVYANTLYVTPLNDNVVEKIGITVESSAEAKQALIGIGLFENRFGWGELPEEQSIIVSGPAEYIKLVKKVLGKPDAKKIDSDIMIFRLKYANADDREIQYRNRVVVTPGVATILRNLLQDKRVKGSNTDLGASMRSPYGGGNNTINGNFNASGGLPSNPSANSRNPEMNYGGRAPSSPFSFLSGGNGGEVNVALDQVVANTGPQSYASGFNVGASPSKVDKNRVPMVEADVRMNAVIIRDDSSKREYYQALINEFDQAPKMVEIEAMILDINRSKLKDLGIDWTVKAGKTAIGVSAVTTGSSLDVLNNALGAGSSILIRNIENFYGRIRALEQDGEAYVLAKPSIITVDNLGAVLDLNRTAYIRLIGERVADVMPVTAGTLLKVTPRVINEGGSQRVHLVVDIEDGELQEAEGSATPSVQRSTISTQAIIEENQALVIGGYQSQTDNRSKQRVPVLGDIPVVGSLFTRSNNMNSNKERIFIIVPRAMARNYKRTYGNNVDGTPLPPAPLPISATPSTIPQSANGLGQIIYKPAQPTQTNITQTINKINNINSANSLNNANSAPSNPFSRTADIAPPTASSVPVVARPAAAPVMPPPYVPNNSANTNLPKQSGAIVANPNTPNSIGSAINSMSSMPTVNPQATSVNATKKAVPTPASALAPQTTQASQTNSSNANPKAIRDVSYLLQGKAPQASNNSSAVSAVSTNRRPTNVNLSSNAVTPANLQLTSQLSVAPVTKPVNVNAKTESEKFMTER
jgi:type III secretion protein C